MKAGRELDLLVAEHIFGWACTDEIACNKEKHHVDRENLWWVAPGQTRKTFACMIPWYSTNISPAWVVVEKMQAKGIHFSIDAYQAHGQNEFGALFGSKERNDAIAGTAPLAICLAALKLS